MPRAPRQARAKETVDTIVEAGFVCVAQRGMAGTTTRHIADAAGLSVGSLYEYFENKEAVFSAMHARFTNDVIATLKPLFPEAVRLDIAPAIEMLLQAFGELLRRDQGRYLRFAQNALAGQLKVELDPLTTVLSELVLQYLLHHPELMHVKDVPVMSYLLIHGGIGVLARHLSESNPQLSFEAISSGLARMVSHYVERELSVSRGDSKSKRAVRSSSVP